MDNPATASMTELANAAFQKAAGDVIRRAIESNTPVIVYRNGAIVKLDPKTMQPNNESPESDSNASQT